MMKRVAFFLALIILAKSSYTQVNLQSGAAQYNIPLYNLTDSKTGLVANVSLGYVNGSGLKVDDNASMVGTGWDLNAGGSISRTVIGLPDDQKYWGTGNPTPNLPYIGSTYYPNGYLYTNISPGDAMPGYAAQMISGGAALKAPPIIAADREMDIFTFQFGGRSGQFYIGKDKSIIAITNSKLSISFEEDNLSSEGIRTTIRKFTVKDEKGFIYTFSEWEANTLLKYNSAFTGWNTNLATQDLTGHEFTSLSEINRKIITKWFLTSVRAPFTTDEVVYSYTPYSVDITEGAKHLTSQTANGNRSVVVQTDRYKYDSKRLNTITLPDSRKIKFVYYDEITRMDVPGESPLKKVEYYVADLGTESLKSYYYLDQGYFVKSQIKPLNYTFPNAEKRFARLCLKSIQQHNANGQGLPPVSFEYNLGYEPDGIGVPARYTLLRDWWGYSSYNRYPIMELETGEVMSYSTFWSLSADDITANAASLGCLTKVKNNSGGIQEFVYEQNTAAESQLTNHYAPGVRVKQFITSDGAGNSKVTEYKYVKANATTSGIGFEEPIIETSTTIRVFKSTNGLSASNFGDAVMSFSHVTDAISSVKGILSAGKFAATPLGLINQWQSIMYLVDILTYLFAPDYVDHASQTYYFDNLRLNNPIPIMYSRVEVSESGNGISGGKTVYDLNSYEDYALLIPTYQAPYSSRMRQQPWLYGDVKKTSYYNASNTLLRETINEYTRIDQEITSSNFDNKKWMATTIASVRYDNDPSNIPGSFVMSENYHPYTGRLELTRTIDNTYDKNSNVSVKTTNYKYNTNNYLLKESESYINDNEVYGKSTFYNIDFDASVNLTAELTNKNIVSLPVLMADWKRVNQTTTYLTGAQASKLAVTDDGSIKIEEEFKREIASPATGTFLASFNPSLAPYANVGFVSEKKFSYVAGNTTQTIDKLGVSSVIMGRDGREVIAKAANANYTDIAFTSFEWLDIGINWIYDGVYATTGNAKTGKRYYELTNYPITSSRVLNSAKTYVITLWARSGSVSVNGSTPALVQSDADGWNLYKTEVSNITSVTITGTALVDDVRLYPKGAMMTTYTYAPFVGASAMSDANNRVSYNEYDDFDRLALTRDHQKNILKYYCYRYHGYDLLPCYGEFINPAITRTIYRNNCGSLGGTSVTYTVEAGKHHAYSQADLDAKVEADFATNGQNKANTEGNCIVYARIRPVNLSYSFYATTGDVIIEFFSDAAGTIPASVSNMEVGWDISDPCGNNGSNGAITAYASGTSWYAGTGIELIYSYFPYPNDDFHIQCMLTYSLVNKPGYIIID
jgi:hypothetical protein